MKITEHIDLIDGTMANCYSVRLGENTVLIDAGMKGSAKKIIMYYNEKKAKPEIILITHYHPDHVGGLHILTEEFKPDVFVPDREVDVITGKAKPVPTRSIMSHIVAGMARITPVGSVKSASELKIDGIHVVETPGHTPGSTSYYVEEDDALFVGDAVNNTRNGLQINKGFTLNLKEAEKSRQIIMEHEAKLILPGHGPPYHKK